MKAPVELSLRCLCSSESLHFSHDLEFPNETLVCIHEQYGSRGLPFWARLRSCWKILTTGYPYGDQVILCAEQMEKLAEYITVCQTYDTNK